jgi:xanthine phosphoribosyltransferase
MQRVFYSYGEFRDDLRYLISLIDWQFDTIVPISRGGLTMGHMLGEYYGIRDVYAINTIGYDDTQKLSTIQISHTPDLKYAKSVLIVDDIVDSGDTILEVLKHLSSLYPDVEFKVASLFYKKSAKITPNWYAKEANEWIDFFWSEDLKDNNGTDDRQLR